MFLCSVTTAKSTYGQIASNLQAACGVGATTCTRIVLKKKTLLQHRNVVTANWWKVRQHILPNIGAVDMQKKYEKRSPEKQVLFKLYYPNNILRSSSSRKLRAQEEHYSTTGIIAGLVDHETSKKAQRQERGQSARDPNANNLSSDEILKALIAEQQIMAELKNSDTEQSRAIAITRIVLYLMNKNDC
jgi:hypothetical protein